MANTKINIRPTFDTVIPAIRFSSERKCRMAFPGQFKFHKMLFVFPMQLGLLTGKLMIIVRNHSEILFNKLVLVSSLSLTGKYTNLYYTGRVENGRFTYDVGTCRPTYDVGTCRLELTTFLNRCSTNRTSNITQIRNRTSN